MENGELIDKQWGKRERWASLNMRGMQNLLAVD